MHTLHVLSFLLAPQFLEEWSPKLLNEVAAYITNEDEVTSLGLHLDLSDHKVKAIITSKPFIY